MDNKSSWAFWLAIAANVSQVLSLGIQVLGAYSQVSPQLNVLILVATLVGIAACLLYVVKPRTPKALQKDLKSGRFENHTQTVKVLLISIVAVFAFYMAFLIYRTSTSDITIVVTDFVDRGKSSSPERTTSQLILDNLEESLKSQSNVKVLSALGSLAEPTSQEARKIGQQRGATIVIWGWYSVRQDKALINPNFEVIASQPALQAFQLRQKIIPRASFESFEFETGLSYDYSYLSGFTIGMIRRSQERYEDAIASFSSLLNEKASTETTALVHNMRGLSYSDSGRSQEAIADYQKAITLSSTDPIYYYNLGAEQRIIGDTSAAIRNLQLSISIDPSLASPLNALAVIFEDAGDYSLAEDYYRRAIKINPTQPIFRANLAGLYFERKEYDPALEQAERALELAPRDVHYHLIKAGILFAQKAFGAVLWEFAQFCFLSQPLLLALFLAEVVGLPLLLIIDHHRKGKVTDWMVSRVAFGISSVILRAFSFKTRKSNTRSNRIVSRSLTFGIMLRLFAYSISGSTARANSLVEQAVSRGMYNSKLLISLGIVYFEQKDYELASKVFSDVLKVDHNNAKAFFYLGWIYEKQDDIQKALLNYQHATSAHEFESVAWLLAGNLRWRLDDLRGALIAWTRAAKHDPQFVVERTLRNLSDPNALSWPQEHFKLGLAYSQLHNERSAKIGFELAIKYGEQSGLARYARFRLSNLIHEVVSHSI